jgi:serine/threonine protein kinase
MLAPGTILQQRYRIVGKLGEGGMGAVYEALDQRLDATVALKETLFGDERLRRQFEREARLLARLHHPALPRVSDHFAEDGGQFLVMQYIPGDDLAGIITQRRGPFPEEQVAMWADQLLDALDYLHTQDPQIVHRDIKPQNLKLTGRGQIVLLDFGLAKGQVHELSRVTTSASIFGYTPNYAPLEQVQGQGTDPRSDLYALAATLYHLVTGIKPPDALTRAGSLVNGEADPLQPANQINSAVGPAFAEVLRRAMAQGRDQRYASAAEMRKALHSGSEETIGLAGDAAATVLFPQGSTQVAVANPTVPARATALGGESTVVRAVPPTRRRVLPWTIAGASLLLAVACVGAFYAFERNKSSQVSEQPTPSPVNSVQIAQPSLAVAGDKSNESSKANTEKEQAKNTPKESKKQPAAKKREKTDEEREADDARKETRDERARDRRAADSPEAPQPPDDSAEFPGRNPRRMSPIITRTRNDGAKVMIMPNGTRIVTMPNGTTRVFPPPGQRPRRRP